MINIFRDPAGGVAGDLRRRSILDRPPRVAFVKGIQGDDPKYFRANSLRQSTTQSIADREHASQGRHRSQRTRLVGTPTYPQIRGATITEGKAIPSCALQCRRPKVPACASKMLLPRHSSSRLGFQGFVTSDCGAIDDFSSRMVIITPPSRNGSAAGIVAGYDTKLRRVVFALPTPFIIMSFSSAA